MMNNISKDTEVLKEIISNNEAVLINTQKEEDRKQLISEINYAKEILVKQYRDISYSTAMTFNQYEEWIRKQGKQQKHKTGIGFIDNIFGGEGIEEEKFINLVGAPGTGKSTLALKILLNVAKKEKAYFVSLEMGRFKTYNEISSKIETPEQRENLYIEIWNDNIDNIERDIELFSHNGCKFFVIDSKMKISLSGKEPTHEKIEKMSNTLSKLTQKLGIIIILINQMSGDNLKNNIVTLKGSNAQDYDTDILFSIEFDKKDDNLRVLNVVKNRQNDVKPKIKYDLSFRETIDVEIGTADMPIIL